MSDDQAQEKFLARELGVLVQDPPPLYGVDVAEALRVGRRRVRRRRAGVGGMALALAAAVAVGAFALPTKSAGPASGNGHPVVDPRDPLTVDATFGWLPPGMHTTVFSTVPHKRSIPGETWALGDKSNAGSAATPTLILFAYPKGIDPAKSNETADPKNGHKTTAPEVNGRAAYWLKNPDLTTVLRWQAADDDRWMEIQALNMPTQGLPEAMLRTAAAVTVEERSVPMPFSLKGIPGLQVSQAESTLIQRGDGQVFGFSTVGFSMPESKPAYFLTVAPHSSTPPLMFPALTEQAKRSSGITVTCITAHGLDACLTTLANSTPSNTPPNLAAISKGLLNRVVLLGTNPQNWTTDVLR